MFFSRLYNKTNFKSKTELKYKLYYWNLTYGLARDIQEIHKLDYVAENWVVNKFSLLHKHFVYDTASLLSFNEYLNNNKLILKIKHMGFDLKIFPTVAKNSDVFFNEYNRIKLLKKIDQINTKTKKNCKFRIRCVFKKMKFKKFKRNKNWIKKTIYRKLRKKLFLII